VLRLLWLVVRFWLVLECSFRRRPPTNYVLSTLFLIVKCTRDTLMYFKILLNTYHIYICAAFYAKIWWCHWVEKHSELFQNGSLILLGRTAFRITCFLVKFINHQTFLKKIFLMNHQCMHLWRQAKKYLKLVVLNGCHGREICP
jgi:hypothetical protein